MLCKATLSEDNVEYKLIQQSSLLKLIKYDNIYTFFPFRIVLARSSLVIAQAGTSEEIKKDWELLYEFFEQLPKEKINNPMELIHEYNEFMSKLNIVTKIPFIFEDYDEEFRLKHTERQKVWTETFDDPNNMILFNEIYIKEEQNFESQINDEKIEKNGKFEKENKIKEAEKIISFEEIERKFTKNKKVEISEEEKKKWFEAAKSKETLEAFIANLPSGTNSNPINPSTDANGTVISLENYLKLKQTRSMQTALHEATKNGNMECVKILVENGWFFFELFFHFFIFFTAE